MNRGQDVTSLILGISVSFAWAVCEIVGCFYFGQVLRFCQQSERWSCNTDSHIKTPSLPSMSILTTKIKPSNVRDCDDQHNETDAFKSYINKTQANIAKYLLDTFSL